MKLLTWKDTHSHHNLWTSLSSSFVKQQWQFLLDISQGLQWYSWLKPFDVGLWLTILGTCNVILLVIWWLDRKSPTGYYHILKETDEDGFTMLGVYLTWLQVLENLGNFWSWEHSKIANVLLSSRFPLSYPEIPFQLEFPPYLDSALALCKVIARGD